MSKREADTQMTKDSPMNGGGSWGSGDAQRATASTMATRKLARPRGSRRGPGGNRPAFGLGATSAAMRQQQHQQQQSFPQFGQSDGGTSNSFGGTSNSFSFGQQANTDPPTQPSQSFPPFQFTGSSANTNAGNAFGSSGNIFNFNPPQAQNPFSSSYSSSPTATSGISHHGSIFNFETPAKPIKDLNNPPYDINGNGVPHFAPGAPEIPKIAPQDTPKPTTQDFTWPSTKQQSAANNQPFSTPAVQQQEQSSTNTEENAPVNIFGGIQSPMAKESQNTNSQSSKGLFQQLTGAAPQPVEQHTPFNPFAALKPMEKPSTAPTNLFGNLSQPSTSAFGATPTSKAPTAPNLFSPEAMQTSPDSTTQTTHIRGAQAPSTPVKDLNAGAKASQTSASPAKGDLFGRITAPEPGSNQGGAKSVDEKAQANDTGSGNGGLFDRVSQPVPNTGFKFTTPETSSVQNTGVKESAPAPASTASNLFGSVTSPTKPTQSAPATNPFASLPMPAKGQENAATAKPASLFENSETAVSNVNKASTSSASNENIKTTVSNSSSEFLEFSELPPLPPHLTADDRVKVTIAWRLKQLDVSFQTYSEKIKDQALAAPLHQLYEDCRKNVLNAGEGPVPNPRPGKRSASALANDEAPRTKRTKVNDLSAAALPKALSPGKSMPKVDMSPAPTHLNGKRKADEDIPREDEGGVSNEKAKRARGPDLAPKSQTSNLFNSIVGFEQAQESSSQVPTPGTLATPSATSGNESPPRRNPFASILSGPPRSAGLPSVQSVGVSSLNSVSDNKGLESPASAPNLFQFNKHADGSSDTALQVDAGNRNVNGGAEKDGTDAAEKVDAAPKAHTATASTIFSFNNPSTTSVHQPSTESSAPKTSVNSNSTSVKPPSFNFDPSMNFMTQFGDAAKKQAEADKKKRKAEEYDSDEDDEAEWEKKDAEEQAQKKQKIEEAAKAAKPFIPQLASTAKDKSAETSKPKSIFDQVHPAFGLSSTQNIFGHLSGSNSEAEANNNAKSDQFKQSTSRSLFDRTSQPSQEATDGDSTADHTWKADSPIKFGASSSSSVPAVSVTIDSTPKSSEGTFLFGNAGNPTASPPNLGASLFGNLNPPKSNSGAVGFGFAPAKGQANALAQPSQDNSRATSPGATTGDSAAESAAENQDEATRPQQQLDLMSQRVGEENEDILHEVRAKALKFDMKEKQHVNKGVGPFRVLKHRDTSKRRVVMRVDPSGAVVINSGILAGGKYEAAGKSTLKATFTDLNGELSLWQIRVKTNDLASKLAEVLNENQAEAS